MEPIIVDSMTFLRLAGRHRGCTSGTERCCSMQMSAIYSGSHDISINTYSEERCRRKGFPVYSVGMTDEQWVATLIKQSFSGEIVSFSALDSNYLKIIRLLISTRDWLYGTTACFFPFDLAKGGMFQRSLETVATAS